nr:hypothetical protein [Mediterraneibacter gnavus]
MNKTEGLSAEECADLVKALQLRGTSLPIWNCNRFISVAAMMMV